MKEIAVFSFFSEIEISGKQSRFKVENCKLDFRHVEWHKKIYSGYVAFILTPKVPHKRDTGGCHRDGSHFRQEAGMNEICGPFQLVES